MAEQRKTLDCREYPSEKNCSLTICGTEAEVLDTGTQHAVASHGHPNTSELRAMLKSALKDAK